MSAAIRTIEQALGRRDLTAAHARLRRLLRLARRFVEDERDHLLENYCVLDRKTLKPRRETLDADGKPYVERCERLMARIDRALEAGAK
jgi:hypothetical protein